MLDNYLTTVVLLLIVLVISLTAKYLNMKHSRDNYWSGIERLTTEMRTLQQYLSWEFPLTEDLLRHLIAYRYSVVDGATANPDGLGDADSVRRALRLKYFRGLSYRPHTSLIREFGESLHVQDDGVNWNVYFRHPKMTKASTARVVFTSITANEAYAWIDKNVKRLSDMPKEEFIRRYTTLRLGRP
jgi:hypothetical protein